MNSGNQRDVHAVIWSAHGDFPRHVNVKSLDQGSLFCAGSDVIVA